jgi:hypothetical protein
MAHGDRWTCGQWGGASNRRVAGSTMGNRPATTRGLGAEGGIGGSRPRPVGPVCQRLRPWEMGGRPAHARRWAGFGAELGGL